MMPLATRLPYSPVEAVIVLLLVEDLADHDRAVFAGVERDLARRPGQRLTDDVDANLLIVIGGPDLFDGLDRAQQRDAAAARQDAFLDRGAGGVHRVVNAILTLLSPRPRCDADQWIFDALVQPPDAEIACGEVSCQCLAKTLASNADADGGGDTNQRRFSD